MHKTGRSEAYHKLENMKKIIRLSILAGIVFLVWKAFGSNAISMENLPKWSASPVLFGVLWGIQAIFMGKWLATEMRSTLSVGPSVYLGWAWLILALILFLSGYRVVAMLLAIIGMAPLVIMLLMLVLL